MSAIILPELDAIPTAQADAGTVYTETVVWSPPEQFAADAPYQLVIVDLDRGERQTGRVRGEQVTIGDRVDLVEFSSGVAYFRKLA